MLIFLIWNGYQYKLRKYQTKSFPSKLAQVPLAPEHQKMPWRQGPGPGKYAVCCTYTLVLSALRFHYWLALKGKCDSWATVITAPLVCSLSFCVQIVFIFMSMSEPLCSTLGNTYLGGPQNTPPQHDWSSVVVLQHNCLLLHCQISGTDICKTQRSELHFEGIEASRAQRGSIRRVKGSKTVCCNYHPQVGVLPAVCRCLWLLNCNYSLVWLTNLG